MNHYIKYLRQSLDNRRGKRKQDECEQILGLNGKVNDFAAFFENHEDDFLIFIAATLQKFESDREFTKEELNIYRLGLTELPLFFIKCLEERERNMKEQVAKIQQMAIEQ